MKRLIYLFTILALFASCKDDINLDSFSNSAKMVMYCFPSTADTTYIRLTRSVPVKKYSDTTNIISISEAAVIYKVNGESRSVENMGGGYYRVVGKQKSGDRINIEASDEGLPSVSANTVIPDTVGISNIGVKEVPIYDNDTEKMKIHDQVAATFTDDAATRCYYAVRVRLTHYLGSATGYFNHGHGTWLFSDYADYKDHKDSENWDSVKIVLRDSAYTYPTINSHDEDLLLPLSDIDDFFGFSNDFYENFYIFSDASINGMKYTLHLDVDLSATYTKYDSSAGPVNYDFNKAYQVELYRITPEYYHFLLSVNDIYNNELAGDGLSQIRPTTSNVSGGFGLVGGWNCSTTQKTFK